MRLAFDFGSDEDPISKPSAPSATAAAIPYPPGIPPLATTGMDLSEEEIIRIYGKRWQIEVFFKTCKSYLHLISECHSLSYDALTAHVAIVFARYMMIAMEQRQNEDVRSPGEIIFYFTDELANITFAQSLWIIIRAMFECIYAVFQVSDEQMDTFITMFVNRLPGYMQRALARGTQTA